MSVREKVRFGKVGLTGVKKGATLTEDTLVLLEDNKGDALLATGTLSAPAVTSGFAKGCLYIDTNVGSGTSGLYVNVGTRTSVVWKLVINAA
jgi:hypothetical protein